MPSRPSATRENLGYRLAKASQRWNDLLRSGFATAGFPEVRASYGSVVIPLFEEDGLRMGEIASRAGLSKQAMTTLVRMTERDGLTTRTRDPEDGRAFRVTLTERARRFRPVAERILEELDALVAAELGPLQVSRLSTALVAVASLDRGVMDNAA